MRPVLALLPALLLLVPTSTAAPVAAAGVDYVHVSWSFGGVSGTCVDHMAYTTETVTFDQALVTMQSARGAYPTVDLPGNPMALLPESACALLVTLTPGVYTNACQILRGEAPSVVYDTDPYFHYRGSGYWGKTVGWGGWNYVDYDVQLDYQYGQRHFHGECRWGDASGSWDVWARPVYV